MDDSFLKKLFIEHQDCPDCPNSLEVEQFFTELLGALFPDHSQTQFDSYARFELHLLNLKEALYEILYQKPNREDLHSSNKADRFFENLPQIYDKLHQDVSAMYAGDPAAESPKEVIRSYPGFYAIAAYRVAHALHELDVKVIPRILTEHAHSKTGIDIHPTAEIGNYFCIDHGTGIVIGATCVIGDHVKIYQGVTLGALSVNKEDAAIKRHPTIKDHVVVYSGATILGGKTVIGEHSIIGGNTWITSSVEANSKVYYQPSATNGFRSDHLKIKKG